MGRIEGPPKETDTLMQQFIGHIKSISHLGRMKNILETDRSLFIRKKIRQRPKGRCRIYRLRRLYERLPSLLAGQPCEVFFTAPQSAVEYRCPRCCTRAASR